MLALIPSDTMPAWHRKTPQRAMERATDRVMAQRIWHQHTTTAAISSDICRPPARNGVRKGNAETRHKMLALEEDAGAGALALLSNHSLGHPKSCCQGNFFTFPLLIMLFFGCSHCDSNHSGGTNNGRKMGVSVTAATPLFPIPIAYLAE
jgi:hypothetical protein